MNQLPGQFAMRQQVALTQILPANYRISAI